MKLDRDDFERAAKAFREGDQKALLEIASRNVKERARAAARRARRRLGEHPGPHAAAASPARATPKDTSIGPLPHGEGTEE